MVISITVYVFLNRRELTEYNGWVELVIYMVFNVTIMISGQRIGSFKDTLKRLYGIIDGEGSAEMRLNEALHTVKMSAEAAGIVFEQYNIEVMKKQKKIKLKKEKQLLKQQKPEVIKKA